MPCKSVLYVLCLSQFLRSLPHNPHRDVGRTLTFFGLAEEQHIRMFIALSVILFAFFFQIVIFTKGPFPLPIDKQISVLKALSAYVELYKPAITCVIKKLVKPSEGES